MYWGVSKRPPQYWYQNPITMHTCTKDGRCAVLSRLRLSISWCIHAMLHQIVPVRRPDSGAIHRAYIDAKTRIKITLRRRWHLIHNRLPTPNAARTLPPDTISTSQCHIVSSPPSFAAPFQFSNIRIPSTFHLASRVSPLYPASALAAQ